MIVKLEQDVSAAEKEALIEKVKSLEYKVTTVRTQEAEYLVGTGSKEFDIRLIGNSKGVEDVHRVSDVYKLVSRKWKVQPTRISLGDGVEIGEGSLSIMAGPCSIESEEQIDLVSRHLVENGVSIMRGGVFKPRSSPYSFRGVGLAGLKTWSGVARANGIKIISEVMDVAQIEEMYPYIDVYQVGARNTQNFNLLDALGRVDKPVLIKRGISGTIEELLQSAEYIFSGGNEKLMLCERGIRTYERSSRNTFDLNAIPILKEKSHLPVISDPSHGIGIRHHVESIALATLMAGADGIIYEVHYSPEDAYSDGQQTVDFRESSEMIRKMREVFALREGL